MLNICKTVPTEYLKSHWFAEKKSQLRSIRASLLANEKILPMRTIPLRQIWPGDVASALTPKSTRMQFVFQVSVEGREVTGLLCVENVQILTREEKSLSGTAWADSLKGRGCGSTACCGAAGYLRLGSGAMPGASSSPFWIYQTLANQISLSFFVFPQRK